MRALATTFPATRTLPAACCALLLAGSAQAALTVDCDLVALRADPANRELRQRLADAMPAEADGRLAKLEAATGWDPRRDLTRAVLSIPDDAPPSLRLVGIPAQRIAGLLAWKVAGVATADGLTAYPLPKGRGALIALAADEALIVPADRVAKVAMPGPLPALTAGKPIRGLFTPPAKPRMDFMTLVQTVAFATDGAGHIGLSLAADDAAAATELERRLGVLKQMVQVGIDGGLTEFAKADRILDSLAVTRDGARLEATLTIAPADRGEVLLDLLGRIKARLGG
ncbi:hypothetical protein LBMAG53_12110 [Planctomycetota bacterium]|nr:hypothetical protein LBMAG53_12110 [Planctomycetota bacterium]